MAKKISSTASTINFVDDENNLGYSYNLSTGEISAIGSPTVNKESVVSVVHYCATAKCYDCVTTDCETINCSTVQCTLIQCTQVQCNQVKCTSTQCSGYCTTNCDQCRNCVVSENKCNCAYESTYNCYSSGDDTYDYTGWKNCDCNCTYWQCNCFPSNYYNSRNSNT